MNCAIPQQLHYKLRVKNPGGWLLKESFQGGGDGGRGLYAPLEEGYNGTP